MVAESLCATRAQALNERRSPGEFGDGDAIFLLGMASYPLNAIRLFPVDVLSTIGSIATDIYGD
jgi:hypothetical protein